jgi:hypothetical protein
LNFNFLFYSRLIASTGQTSTQAPQSTQASASITAFSLAILIASLGHSSTHDSHPVHFFLSTLAAIIWPFQKSNLQAKFIRSIPYGTSERRMLQNSGDITT